MTDIITPILRFITLKPSRNIFESRREVITRLKFIGSLAPQEKIDCHTLQVESSSIWTPLKRLFYGDSRTVTLSFFSGTVDRAGEIIDGLINSNKTSERIACANLIHDLLNAVSGLRAAQKTYAADKLFYCEIETLIEQVEARAFELQKSHPDIFSLKETSLFNNQCNNLVNENKQHDKSSKNDRKIIYDTLGYNSDNDISEETLQQDIKKISKEELP